jgi:hypothetical protein
MPDAPPATSPCYCCSSQAGRNRIRNDDGTGKVNDRRDAMFLYEGAYEILVADIAYHQFGTRVDCPAKPGRKIVEHDNLFARIHEFKHHVATDVAAPPSPKPPYS